jgi:hypothetical protein
MPERPLKTIDSAGTELANPQLNVPTEYSSPTGCAAAEEWSVDLRWVGWLFSIDGSAATEAKRRRVCVAGYAASRAGLSFDAAGSTYVEIPERNPG